MEQNILKLKQKLKSWKKPLDRLSPQQQRLALLVGAGLLLLLAYTVIIEPLLDLQDRWGQEVAQRGQLLSRYRALQENREAVNQSLEKLRAALAQTEGALLVGPNPAVAAADLQELFKNLTKKFEVQVTSTKVLPFREAGPYLEIPLQVQFTGNIEPLLAIVYELENNQKLLMVSELEVNAPRWMARGQPAAHPLRVDLVIEGLMKKESER
jgi:hypothetical protein